MTRANIAGMSLLTNAIARQMRRTRIGALWLVVAAVFLCTAGPALAQSAVKRVALVIGNTDYEHYEKLQSPRDDARRVAKALKAAGFALVDDMALVDLNNDSMKDAIRKLERELDEHTVMVMYYSGHGIEYQGRDYLVPVNVEPKAEDLLDYYDIDELIQTIQQRKNGLSIIILDACRTNPFPTGNMGGGAGLAGMRVPHGIYMAFATQPGQVALDNSAFASALTEEIGRPGIDLLNTFNNVANRVDDVTQHAQRPWLSNSGINGNFYFMPSSLPETGRSGSDSLQIEPYTAPQAPCATKLILESASIDGDGVGHFVVTDPCGKLGVISTKYLQWTFTQAASSPTRAEFDFDFFAGPQPVVISASDGRSLPYPPPQSVNRAGLTKAVIIWDGPIDLALHAFENSADPGSEGDVWRKNARSRDDAKKRGVGYMSQLGGNSVPGTHFQVYTYRRSSAVRSVDFRVNKVECNQSGAKVRFWAMRYEDGEPTSSDLQSRLVVTARQCGRFDVSDADEKAPRARHLEF